MVIIQSVQTLMEVLSATVFLDLKEMDLLVKVIICPPTYIHCIDMYSIKYDVDIDECVSGSDNCSNAKCVNNDGGFVCDCFNGYVHNNSSSLQSACGKNTPPL